MWTHRAHPMHGRPIDLMSGGSELLDLGLMAERVSAASRRIAGGGSLDGADQAAIAEMRDLLAASAQVVRFFGSEGTQGAPPSHALAARVDVAIDAVVRRAKAQIDSDELELGLNDRAAALAALLDSPEPATAVKALGVCSDLAAAVLRETARPGELTATFGG